MPEPRSCPRPARPLAPRSAVRRPAFTLVELLVVVTIISVLAALLLPALGKAADLARLMSCANNQRQIGFYLQQYADDFSDRLPSADYSAIGGGLASWTMHLINSGYPAFPGNAADRASLLFRCPNDKLQRTENDGVTPNAIRHKCLTSYCANRGWDGSLAKCGPVYTSGNLLLGKQLAALPQPSGTIAYGECPQPAKRLEWYMGAMYVEPYGMLRGDDFSGASGAYYASLPHHGSVNFLFCDGHVTALTWAIAASRPALWTAAAD